MLAELLCRFVVGGTLVVLFAILGERVRPKTLAGIFGAAPSIALAMLTLAWFNEGPGVVTIEAKSMVAGSAALLAYTATTAFIIARERVPVWLASALLWGEWGVIAFGIWAAVLRA